MSEDDDGSTRRGVAAPRAPTTIEVMSQTFPRLPDVEQKLFNYGPLYLAGNAAFRRHSIAKQLYRRLLNVSHARVATSLPMAVIPFITTAAFYSAAVSLPLLSGTLDCPSCALIRGALVGAVVGGVYPVLLALPVNGNALRSPSTLSRPVLRKMRPVFVLQALFGTYLSSRHFDTYKKLVELASFSEEISD
ncbi:hypothetical protein CRUP_000792 [Coryphaenoides rupestris]|nr:hypothetical protein CRUP_000792 [Coryphaenoides rupestris]